MMAKVSDRGAESLTSPLPSQQSHFTEIDFIGVMKSKSS